MVGQRQFDNSRVERLELLVDFPLLPGNFGQLHDLRPEFLGIHVASRLLVAEDELLFLIQDPIVIAVSNTLQRFNVGGKALAKCVDCGIHLYNLARQFLINRPAYKESSQGIDAGADPVPDLRRKRG